MDYLGDFTFTLIHAIPVEPQIGCRQWRLCMKSVELYDTSKQ